MAARTTLRAVLAAACAAAALIAVPPARAAEPSCQSAKEQVEGAMLRQAEAQLLELGKGVDTCDGLLKIVREREKAAARLVAIGDALAAGDTDAAAHEYLTAYAIDRGTKGDKKAKALERPATDPACWSATRLLTAGQVGLAKAEYLQLQEREAPCAKAGLEAVARREAAVTAMIAIGNGLDDAGDHEHAVEVLTTATNLDAGSKAAKDALDEAKSKDAFDSAKKQGDEWLDDLANLGTWLGGALAWVAAVLVALLLLAWLARVLQSLRPVRGPILKRFPPGGLAIGFAAATGLSASLIAWLVADLDVGAVTAALTLAALVAACIRPAVRFLQRTLFKILLKIDDFGVAEDAKADGAGLAEHVSSAIRDGTPPSGYAVDSAGAAGMKDAFDEVTTALSGIAPGKIAGALLTLVRVLLPSRVVTVGGHVHAQSGAGCGLSLKIVEGRGRLVGDVTLWQGTYGCTGAEPSEVALRRLAVAGAAWLRFRLSDVYDLPFRPGMCSHKSWESEAAYQASLEVRGEPAIRRALILTALAHDPKNHPALFDAAVFDLRDDDVDRAARRLRLVVAGTKQGEPLWCKAMYQRAAIGLAAVPAEGPGTVQTARAAYRAARIVLLSVLEQIADGTGDHLDELRKLEGPLMVTTASTVLLATGVRGAAPLDTQELTPGWRTDLRARLDAALVPSLAPGSPSAAELVARIDAGDVPVGERTHYNLACFSSREASILAGGAAQAAAFDTSLKQLELALASKNAGLTSWAKQDSGLAGVRAARPRAFDETTGEATPRGLAGIRVIGPGYAAALEAEGIKTVADLASAPPAQLAEALGVSAAMVNRWAGLAALRKLPLLTDEYLNQLDEADVRTPADLAGPDLAPLRAKLSLANGCVPPRALLDLWRGEVPQAPGG